TVVVAPATMKKQLVDADHFMRAGDMVQLEALDVLAVPAYNVDKKFHHAEDGWLGYVFSVAGTTFYHAGDTDFLPSMSDIRCDVAFLPCGGHYTMGVEDAARAAEACGAEVLVPIHWGEPHGTRAEVERLRDLFDGELLLLERAAGRKEVEGAWEARLRCRGAPPSTRRAQPARRASTSPRARVWASSGTAGTPWMRRWPRPPCSRSPSRT